ncbi:ferrochelatase [Kineococcus xinjiangensis]|uniref:Coproporphyrin III ferrochelatase n=1 Tax=Kineococcus xinjiangensis TaxID=512762 RepID=A0A2S6IW52_9ACTN|nr:ferrochelatase [Kineococcus xinjiangensis]PPK98381.1 ferrochelatase [Kineococcus xinjiangensis]
MSDVRPYDALLLLSFGGPEGPDDVMPFLENVTRGRGIPRQRLEEVAEHYLHFGGRSPINDQNRALLAALGAELRSRGLDVPLVWGNRNWAPYLTDALREVHEGGARRVLAVLTSAYSSYSSCRQYREDLARSVAELAAEGRALAVDKLRHYFNHPAFVDTNARAVLAALEGLDEGVRASARLVFVTHSVPDAMNDVSGPEGGAYVRQHLDVAAAVAARVAESTGREHAWDLVYCSRSGPPSQPWLEPDVNDHLRELAGQGAAAVVLAPVGFVSDHMEVVFDLDTEALETAAELGLPCARAATVGTDAHFVAGLVDLVEERAALARGGSPAKPAAGSLGPSHEVCPVGCCRNLRADLPAATGADYVPPTVVPPTGQGGGA